MAITAIRTVIIYIFIITAMRIMGKRQLGELQPVELVVTLLISDLAAVPMQESGMPLLNGLIPILILVSLELLLSGAMLKLPWVSRLITGNPITILRDGQLDQKALKKLRMTVDDLKMCIRDRQRWYPVAGKGFRHSCHSGKRAGVYLLGCGLPAENGGRFG